MEKKRVGHQTGNLLLTHTCNGKKKSRRSPPAPFSLPLLVLLFFREEQREILALTARRQMWLVVAKGTPTLRDMGLGET